MYSVAWLWAELPAGAAVRLGGVKTILDGEEDQLARVLGELDAIGVLREGHLPVGGVEGQLDGVLVTYHLGLGTVQGPGG
jgi:hypothetical protein